MEIILTHEQADFDAIAAMMAAYLLADQSKAVLPVKLNRNVRRFINLYGFDLPFLETRDLPHQESIEQITLVDTQSLVTLKGTTKNTHVHVVDHHQEKLDLPTRWTRSFHDVGATTTPFVEQLQDRQTPLSMIQSTLLLLGIYEDTGSLSYASTTVRDIKAAAYLLEKGGNLRIAADFLNPSLSEEQRHLADRLIENVTTLSIHDKTILISSADAREMKEEISSVAHKLRDLLDPDALFLFVRTSEGIRFIGRSTSDDINVGKIAMLFGGGGHDRASAALIDTDHHPEIPTTELILRSIEKLITELKDEIRPSLTVEQIMSRKPLLISPETTLVEADKLMQRYGYEGFPVINEGKIVGLLTRRAVDRARSHKLNLNTGSLMEAGTFSLSPDQSLETVQKMMSETGWGQIPVIDPATGAITGIVTRTDVLNNLIQREKPIPKPENYALLIEKALPPARLALLKNLIEIAMQEKKILYIVGGFVRDLLLEKPSKDFDIVVEGDAQKLAQALVTRFGGRVVSHRQFGTAKWQIKEIRNDLVKSMNCQIGSGAELPDALDLISARTEFYDHPSALPTVERSSIKQDLHRRDFTINTLALRLDGNHFGELHDYWGGLKDLEGKQVKVLHSLSFVDDPTRLLRAVRFEQRFGFQIEERTLQLLIEARERLRQVSGDRIRHELDLILKESNPVQVLERLTELDLLESIHPDLRWDPKWTAPLEQALFSNIDPLWGLPKNIGCYPLRMALAYLIWFTALGESASRAISERLRFSNGLLQAIRESAALDSSFVFQKKLSVSELTRELQGIPLVSLYAHYCLTPNKFGEKQKILDFVSIWRTLKPVTTGETLLSMGIPPGPRYSQILDEILSAWLDGKIRSEKEETSYLKNLIQNNET
ncbi:MAG: CBS domain-containing protein [Chloroflexi bacterium]|nr:CBS domain-containing protein [Chloroflexota bacterium]